jgi:sugar/nucleoside kinase (ribokinase family)
LAVHIVARASPARALKVDKNRPSNSAGALLGVRGEKAKRVPAMQIRSVVNTTGAGDALFSCFVHFYFDGEEPILALRKASVFAAYKIGESGAAGCFEFSNNAGDDYDAGLRRRLE